MAPSPTKDAWGRKERDRICLKTSASSFGIALLSAALTMALIRLPVEIRSYPKSEAPQFDVSNASLPRDEEPDSPPSMLPLLLVATIPKSKIVRTTLVPLKSAFGREPRFFTRLPDDVLTLPESSRTLLAAALARNAFILEHSKGDRLLIFASPEVYTDFLATAGFRARTECVVVQDSRYTQSLFDLMLIIPRKARAVYMDPWFIILRPQFIRGMSRGYGGMGVPFAAPVATGSWDNHDWQNPMYSTDTFYFETAMLNGDIFPAQDFATYTGEDGWVADLAEMGNTTLAESVSRDEMILSMWLRHLSDAATHLPGTIVAWQYSCDAGHVLRGCFGYRLQSDEVRMPQAIAQNLVIGIEEARALSGSEEAPLPEITYISLAHIGNDRMLKSDTKRRERAEKCLRSNSEALAKVNKELIVYVDEAAEALISSFNIPGVRTIPYPDVSNITCAMRDRHGEEHWLCVKQKFLVSNTLRKFREVIFIDFDAEILSDEFLPGLEAQRFIAPISMSWAQHGMRDPTWSHSSYWDQIVEYNTGVIYYNTSFFLERKVFESFSPTNAPFWPNGTAPSLRDHIAENCPDEVW
eukprot:CAMPEP_0198366128 /NCGR_PEP_ID=MMETSP1450-20131203/154526_1 /TAXON_ID=753684 ORGANISM="Madagascaria erythrocladiodes, Strain CCMP3234" /NCGR_SAMPLE_ID=MMETSP1450 /ASSEMBLY_ACC=CAM_ASM_001115 /LENGTH=581 /DNA_ID=CAMNT_0044073593 /DNA_START=58 /DNA_END=1800 /DNA_ORIENTATION=-